MNKEKRKEELGKSKEKIYKEGEIKEGETYKERERKKKSYTTRHS